MITLFNVETVEEAQKLIDSGVDVNEKDSHGITPICNFKIIRRSDSSVYGEYFHRDINITKLLINCGADVNAQDEWGCSPLHRPHNNDIIKLLIDNGADVNAKDNNGNSPLHGVDSISKASVLVTNGADINAKNNYGATPVYFHCLLNSKVANYLINRGCIMTDENWASYLNLFDFEGKMLVNQSILA